MEAEVGLWLASTIMVLFSLFLPVNHYISMNKHISQISSKPGKEFHPPITIILPMKNEASNVIRKIKEIEESTYPQKKIFVLFVISEVENETSDLARNYLTGKKTEFKWRIVTTDKQGKSRAVNLALGLVETEFFVMMDADSISEQTSLNQMMSRFSDNEIGAVSGFSMPNKGSLDYQYRSRFNKIHIGESVIDSTPVFEGSLCAFRVCSLEGMNVNPDINADDTQLALLTRKNGYRAVMDPFIGFLETNQTLSRKRKIRRAQGLVRVFLMERRIIFSERPFSKIFFNNFYFYLIFPGFFTLSVLASLSSSIYLILKYGITEIQLAVLLFMSIILIPSKTFRSFASGLTTMLEAQIRLFFGNTLEVWIPERKP